MEIDVASIGTSKQTKMDTKTPRAGKQELRPILPSSLDRKRRKTESPSTALKSILRQRSDLASNCSVLVQKLKRKRAVKFTMEERAEDNHQWSDKRLRYLALDLDRWDNLPHSALRTINKQKTRHTKRLKCCHSTDDLDHGRVPRPQMDDGASLKCFHTVKKDFMDRSPGMLETVPEMEPIEKSFFVSRWLQQSSQSSHSSSVQHLLHNSGGGVCCTPHTSLPSFSFSPLARDPSSAFSHFVFGVPSPSVSLGAPGVSRRTSVAPFAPETTSSLQNLTFNFHTMSLKSASSWRPE